MKCTDCKAEMPENSLFCTNCGKKRVEKSTPLFCTICGTTLESAQFGCPNCGSIPEKVEDLTAPSAPPINAVQPEQPNLFEQERPQNEAPKPFKFSKKSAIITAGAAALAVIILTISLLTGTAVSNQIDDKQVSEDRGNSVGNLANGADLAVLDNYILYNTGYTFNKMKNNAQQSNYIANDGRYINADNNWIYYIANRTLYKYAINANTPPAFMMDNVDCVCLVEGWLYYCSSIKTGGIYKMSVSGSGSKSKLSSDAPEAITVSGGYIYYTLDDTLRRVNTSGFDGKTICDDNANYINVTSEWIYFSNANDLGRPYKVKIDGTERKKLCDETAVSLNVYKGVVYFVNGKDSFKPYKVDTNGKNLKKISDDKMTNIIIEDDAMYYLLSSESAMYKMNLDGKDKQMVFSLLSPTPSKGSYSQYN